MNIATQTVQIGLEWDTRTGAVTIPIYQTATFRHPGLGQSTGFDYSRSGNPTRQALEDGIARLDNGARGFAYSSGMAAIASLLLLFKSGDHLIVTEDLYGGTCRLFDQVFNQYGLTFTYVDTSDSAAVEAAIRPETRALFVETLTNPLLKFADLPALSTICKAHSLLLIADNTFLTPYLLRPLELGADITVYSATKYLSGHNDVVSGLAVAKDPALAEQDLFPPERRRRHPGCPGRLAGDPRHEDPLGPAGPPPGECPEDRPLAADPPPHHQGALPRPGGAPQPRTDQTGQQGIRRHDRLRG